MVPTWLPKPSQNAAKMASKSHSTSKQPKCAKCARRHSESSIFEGSGVPSWHKNPPKIRPRGHQKQDAILNRFLMALGPILGRFWKPSWSQVGTKIAPRWHRNRYQNIVKKLIENLVRKGMQGAAGRRRKSGCWPLRNYPQCPQGHKNSRGLRTLHYVPEARWRIYVYI